MCYICLISIHFMYYSVLVPHENGGSVGHRKRHSNENLISTGIGFD